VRSPSQLRVLRTVEYRGDFDSSSAVVRRGVYTHYRARTHHARRPIVPRTTFTPPFSTTHNSTNMEAIDKAIADLEAHGPVVKGQLTETAKKYGVNRSTLGRRWRGETSSKKEGYEQRCALTPQQELELVKYIEEQGVKGLAPTRQMVQNFASKIAQTPLSSRWVSRFLNRHQPDLISKYTTGMDRNRHLANLGVKYR
jgi:hypothetical protein